MLTALLLAGCTHLSAADRAPRTDPLTRLSTTEPSPWREDFGDPVLRGLLDQADVGALDTKMALARLERADAEVEAADAVRTFNAVAGVSAAVGGASFDSGRGAATPTLEIHNELDIWGRLAHGRRAARAERSAVLADLAGARVQVGAETARSYYALLAARALEATARERAVAAQNGLDLARRRAALGTANDSDLAPYRAELSAAADLEARDREQADLELARLRALTGATVDAPLRGDALGAVCQQAASSPLPSDIVDRRPDVRAAFERVAAADQHRAAAIAATRPQFQFAAALGSPDAAVATLLDVRALAWAAAGAISQQILDGGARHARVHMATAAADIADVGYRQTTLAAWQEIRTADVQAGQARRTLLAARAAEASARAALKAGETRHSLGAADGLALVALRRSLAQAEQARTEACLQMALSRIALAVATGAA